MTGQVKVGGAWKTATPYVKVAGTWRLPKSCYNKVAGAWQSWFLQGGLNDGEFTKYDIANGAGSAVECVAVQSDGKTLAGGTFTTFNGTTVGRIVRLNANGTLDTAFMASIGTGANSTVRATTVQTDGKIIVGGDFTTWNGATVGRIVRLNADGTLDTAFMASIGTGAGGGVQPVAVQTDGKILVGGGFTTWNGTTVGRIVRLNADGTRDTAFSTNTGTGSARFILTVVVQADGKILVGTGFSSTGTWNGTTLGNMFRLNANGTHDTAFFANAGTGSDGAVEAIAVQADGKIVLGGGMNWNGAFVYRFLRLNADGTRDTAFSTNVGRGAEGGGTRAITVQTDGKILVGGTWQWWDNVDFYDRFLRLNADGTRDTAFTNNRGSVGVLSVAAIKLRADGKILVGGNGGAPNLVRFNADWTLDTAFAGPASMAANAIVYAVAAQADGRILIGGSFTTWNGVTVNRIVRINADGTRDTAFTTSVGTGVNGPVYSVAAQADGRILVGGNFTTWNGAFVNRIVRINANGTLDTAFMANAGTGASGGVQSVAAQADGRILVGGNFTTWNGTTVNRILRLNADGTLDTAFTTNTNTTGTAANNIVYAIATQTDGKIIVGGAFSKWDGDNTGRIVRLNADGTRDTAFMTNAGTGANTDVYSVAAQADGRILVGGNFTTWNGTTVNRILRLNADGTRDTAFTTNTGTAANGIVYAVVVQADGRILVGGSFTTWNGVTVNRIVRLNADGTRDTAFTTNTGTGVNGAYVWAVAAQADGRILVGGSFTGFNNINRSYIARIGGDAAA